jgi:hypothetical protein
MTGYPSDKPIFRVVPNFQTLFFGTILANRH